MNSDTSHLPSRRRLRTRIAVGLTASTLLVAAAVAIAATALAAWQPSEPATPAQAGAARVGDEVTVVIVTDEGSEAAAQARTDTLRWTLVALTLSVVPAVFVGWFAAGRMLGSVDSALAQVNVAEEDRRRRLQEVVHELRTPLAVMGTNLELAAGDSALDADSVGFINAARRAAGRMRRTVDDLDGYGGLAVSTAEATVEVSRVVDAVATEQVGPAHARGLHLEVIGDTATELAHIDAGAIHTVLGNLVGNAVRLAPRGSTIRIDWGDVPDWVWVAVADEGPGLPETLHNRVFERGWRGRHDRDRGDGGDGSGLGLTIARQLTEAQGGVVTIESEEGIGSTFTIWLPRSVDATRADVAAPDGIHAVIRPWLRNLTAS
jgi:signal transduction histidine kinase